MIPSRMLNTAYALLRNDRVSDNRGGWTEYSDTTEEGMMRLWPAGTHEIERAAKMGIDVDHLGVFLPSSDVQSGDIVYAGGIALEAIGVVRPSKRDHHIKVTLKERQEKI